MCVKMLLAYILSLNFILITCQDCGPLGYNAEHLLSPAYWYFDLESNCPSPPIDHHFSGDKFNETTCRIYFNLCKSQKYQCSGAVCAGYLSSKDLVSNLGEYSASIHPFKEDYLNEGVKVPFIAEYVGELLACGHVKTRFSFYCDASTHWNISVDTYHGGSHAIDPISVSFNNDTCQFDIRFNTSEACVNIPGTIHPGESISYGSIILILFFPTIVLYFILGALFNRMRGFSGKDMIPHRTFWIDLPELIMDGFIFTMATITCKYEDRYSKEYDEVE